MNLYMDESGSVHSVSSDLNRFFIIGIMMPNDIKKLKRVYKLFIRKNFEKLKDLDKQNKMFEKSGKFLELKGYCFNKQMKLEFLQFFCQNHLLKIGYIVLDNNQLQERFILNKARTFNYLLKLFLTSGLQRKYILGREMFLHIDERNVKTDSRFSLEDYLNQEIVLNLDLMDIVHVQYYDSARNQLIQIADVFSNIMYSNIMTHGAYQKELEKLVKDGYILPLFRFPKQTKNFLKLY